MTGAIRARPSNSFCLAQWEVVQRAAGQVLFSHGPEVGHDELHSKLVLRTCASLVTLHHLVNHVVQNSEETLKSVSYGESPHGKARATGEALLDADTRQNGNCVIHSLPRLDRVQGRSLHVLKLQFNFTGSGETNSPPNTLRMLEVKLNPELRIGARRSRQPIE